MEAYNLQAYLTVSGRVLKHGSLLPISSLGGDKLWKVPVTPEAVDRKFSEQKLKVK